MDKSDSLYMTIYNYLKENILNNCYANGVRIPTEMELAKQFYVSRITSKRALNALVEDGLIVRIPGKGSYVKDYYIKHQGIMLNSGIKKSIALVMGGYSNSFGLDILNGVMDTAEEMSLNMVLKATYSFQEKEGQIITSLMNSGVSGIIVQPAQGELYSEAILKAVYSGYPIVMIDRKMQGINAPFVGIDNQAMGALATEKLIEKNHRNIALIALADEKSSTINERKTGHINALVNNGISVNKDLFLTRLNRHMQEAGISSESADSYDFIVNEIMTFLKEHEEVTAILGTEYSVSKAAYDAVRKLGKKVPKDISIASFDMYTGHIGLPVISHVMQPQRLMGIRACEILNDMINGRTISELNCILPGEWVDGHSIS